MYKLCIDANGYCVGYLINDEPLENEIGVYENLYPTDNSYIGRKFDSANMCWINEYADWYKSPPQPKLSETELQELDRDELLIDILINQQDVLLTLQGGI